MSEPRIQVRAREAPAGGPEPASSEQGPRSRGERVREALRCPYCKDGVGRSGAVACARRGCGATYHRECWEECRASYGGCAVFGCGAVRSRELTALGWALRFVRLALAALLFPPRVLRAVRLAERDGVFWRAQRRARWIYAAQNRNGSVQTGWVLCLGIPLSYLLLWSFGFIPDPRAIKIPGAPFLMMAIVLAGPFLILVLPYLAASAALAGWYGVRAFVAGLRGELAALERGDLGETVLARLTRGAGKKG